MRRIIKGIINIFLKFLAGPLTFLVLLVCIPFVVVGSWTIPFIEWIYREGR